MLTFILVALSSILTVAAVIPYLIEVIKGTTKPRVVSWFVWSLLTSIACAAAFVDGQYPTGILLLFASLETLSVVILGWKHGDKKIERLDIICLIGALVGLVLWLVFDSPAVAVVAMVAIDLLGGIPTLVHSWKKPHEETAITFFLSFLGATCILFLMTDWRITAFAYPLYLVVANFVFTVVIVARKRKIGV